MCLKSGKLEWSDKSKIGIASHKMVYVGTSLLRKMSSNLVISYGFQRLPKGQHVKAGVRAW